MLDSVMAEKAVVAVRPMVLHLMETQLIELHLRSLAIMVSQRKGTTFDVVLSTYIGEAPCRWTYPYDETALQMTRISARTGLSVQEVVAKQPELLREGPVWRGRNAVQGDLIVSCSGVQPWFNEAAARSVIAMMNALGGEPEWSFAYRPEEWKN